MIDIFFSAISRTKHFVLVNKYVPKENQIGITQKKVSNFVEFYF